MGVSDRSGQGGKIGSATYYSEGREKWVVRKYMVTEEKHTIYEAELVGLSLAAELMSRSGMYEHLRSEQTARL